MSSTKFHLREFADLSARLYAISETHETWSNGLGKRFPDLASIELERTADSYKQIVATLKNFINSEIPSEL